MEENKKNHDEAAAEKEEEEEEEGWEDTNHPRAPQSFAYEIGGEEEKKA